MGISYDGIIVFQTCMEISSNLNRFTTDDNVPILKVVLYYTLGDKETLGQWSSTVS